MLKYSGDQTQSYDHGDGTGLVGKVVGPNHKGEWFVITSARYDEPTDTTYADAEPLPSPDYFLNKHLEATNGHEGSN